MTNAIFHFLSEDSTYTEKIQCTVQWFKHGDSIRLFRFEVMEVAIKIVPANDRAKFCLL